MTGTTSEGDARALAILAVRRGPGVGTELAVRQPVVSIGRGAKSDVLIEDDSVSTTHAALEYNRDGWWLTDLGSANGTFVEGIRLAPDVPTPLTYGSTVSFGAVQTHFRPVVGADPDAARDAYRPPPPPLRLVERRRGVRLPLWLVLLLVLVIVIAAVWFGLVWTPEPAPTPIDDGGAIGLLTGRLPPTPPFA
jgi:hypothetical protein